MSLAQYMTEFRIALQLQKRRSQTINSYVKDVKSFARWFQQQQGRSPNVEEIDADKIRAYRNYMSRERGLSAFTINRRLTGLRAFLEWGVKAGRLSANAGKQVTGVKQRAAMPRWLNREEVERLRVAVSNAGKRERAIILLLLNTGLRVGELTALRYKDVRFTEGGGELHIREGRGGVSRRVPLNAEARAVLAAYLAEHLLQPEDRLLRGRRGGLGERSVQRLVRQYTLQAGLEAVNIHTLRHTFCKNLVDAGVPLERVAMLLGYANLNPLRVYTTPDESDLPQDVERIIYRKT